jgi:hypothetical protein
MSKTQLRMHETFLPYEEQYLLMGYDVHCEQLFIHFE